MSGKMGLKGFSAVGTLFSDRLLGYCRATPERALLDWLYLGHSPVSTLAPPPGDMDIDLLDRKRLNRLATCMTAAGPVDMLSLLDDWITLQKAVMEEQDRY